MLQARYAGAADFRYVNLGDAIDLANPHMSFDGMHLTNEGNRRLAARLAAPVRELIGSAR